eukprot:13814838-Ditylum_brightwellii.AAC.1
MDGKILKLIVERQHVLKIAACTGSCFDLEMMSLILGTKRIPAGNSFSSFDCCDGSAVDYLKSFPNDVDLSFHLDEAIGK